MDKLKALVTDGVHPILLKGLEDLGYHIDYEPAISLQEAKDRIEAYHGLVINSKIRVDAAFLDAATKLKWLGRLGSGLEIIDRPYAEKCKVKVFSSPQGNAPAVAEHALAMILALSNKILLGDQQVRTKAWDREAARGWELKYKTIGIIGYGHTGPAFAKVLRGFEPKILAYDKYKRDFTKDTPWVQAVSSPNEIFEQADIISLHLPLTDETINYLNEENFSTTRKGVLVVNTSRGMAINLNALIHNLSTGQVGGACLDVFPNEKPPTYTTNEDLLYSKLFDFENTILSPHVAGWTVESKQALAEIILNQVKDFHVKQTLKSN